MNTLYDQDFYLWTQQTASALREGRLSEIDIENTAEEIESLGNSDRDKLESHLRLVAMHLLKWQAQPDLRGKSWIFTIRVHRRDTGRLMKKSPSLRSKLEEALAEAYPDARQDAALETGIPEESFPDSCPWTIEQILNREFYPE